MLFLDSDFVNSADLLALDPEVTKVAASEQITVDTPAGIAAQACNEVGHKLLIEMPAFSSFPTLGYNPTGYITYQIGPAVNRSRIALAQVVVSGSNPTESAVSNSSPLKLYTIYTALYLFYRAAFYKKSNDRYDNKRKMFEEEMRKKYWPRLFNTGCPVVNKPLACPGAIHEYNAGTWSDQSVSAVAGVNANALTSYEAAVTWVDSSIYVSPLKKGNGESGPSSRATVGVDVNQVMQLSIAGLNPPNGLAPLNVQLGQNMVTPGNATGWNVYVGSVGGTLYLQNAVPLPISTLTYTLAGSPVLSGYQSDQGQYPSQYLTMQKTLMRG